MEKTEDKRNIIVIDEQGNKLESTYPKRAKGLIKNGRARVVDENTICLVDLPKHIILEENKMNNNINLEENKEVKIDLAYIMSKIDAIIEMNHNIVSSQVLSEVPIPGSKSPVQCVCETNNKMIEFLERIYQSFNPTKVVLSENVLIELINTLNSSISDFNADPDLVNKLIDILSKYVEK